MSGHSGAGGFSGKDGGLRRENFINALQLSPKLRNNIVSLLLRGCYTTTLAEVLPSATWRKTFPNLTMISGYEGKAWSSEKVASKSFVKEILQLEANFLLAKTTNDLIKVYKSLSHYKISEIAMWVKTNTGEKPQENFITTLRLNQGRVPIDLAKINKACKLNEGNAKDYSQEINMFWAGTEPGYYRPLKNTHTSKNKLRKAYGFFNKNHHCKRYGFWPEIQNSTLISPNRIMPLLFFNKIAENFGRAYDQNKFSQLVSWANKMLFIIKKDFSDVNELSFPDITGKTINDELITSGMVTSELIKASRGTFLSFQIDLDSFLVNANVISEMKQPINQQNLTELKQYAHAYKQLLIYFSPIELPHSWMTDNIYENRIISWAIDEKLLINQR